MDDLASKGSAVHPVKKYNRILGDEVNAIEGDNTADAIIDGKSRNRPLL